MTAQDARHDQPSREGFILVHAVRNMDGTYARIDKRVFPTVDEAHAEVARLRALCLHNRHHREAALRQGWTDRAGFLALAVVRGPAKETPARIFFKAADVVPAP